MKLLPLLALLFLFFSIDAQAKLKNTILLIHGATVSGSVLKVGPFFLGEYFQGVPEHLKSLGVNVELMELPSNSSIEERAVVVKNFLETHLAKQKVNIIAHSLGGLDARYLVSILQSKQVASITSIGTPHHGTPLADWAFAQMKEKKFWFQFFRFLGYDMSQRRFLPELTTNFVEKIFNPKVKDRADIKYFSVVGTGDPWKGTMSALLWYTYIMLKRETHPMSLEACDGLVPASSQHWGAVLAELPLDHLAQMNHYTFRLPHQEESFAMYTKIVQTLEQQGL